MKSILLSVVVGFAVAEEEFSEADFAVGITLIASISMVMLVFYLIHSQDADIRMYAYQAVNSTISIFCAVLFFSSFNDIFERVFVPEDLKYQPLRVFFKILFLVFWFMCMQYVLGKCSLAMNEEKKKELEEQHIARAKSDMLRQVVLDLKGPGMLMAHMAGFAAINAFASLQNMSGFNSNAFSVFLAIPCAAAFMLGMFQLTNSLRTRISQRGDGSEKPDDFEKLWFEETQEAENDVLALCISFMLAQALRFATTGVLPNDEGEEEETLWEHSCWDSLVLFLFALVAIAGSVGVFMLVGRDQRLQELEEESSRLRIMFPKLSVELAGEEEEEEESSEEEGNVVARSFGRLLEISDDICGMTYAWCCYYSLQTLLATSGLCGRDTIILAVALAITTSIVAFGNIFVLDWFADRSWTADNVDRIIRQVIGAIGVQIGFAWEQCFDTALAAVSSRAVNPSNAKFCISLFCCFLMIPAWKKHILPMVFDDGWRCGFIGRQVVAKVLPRLHAHPTASEEDAREALIWKLRYSTMVERMADQISEGSVRGEAHVHLVVDGRPFEDLKRKWVSQRIKHIHKERRELESAGKDGSEHEEKRRGDKKEKNSVNGDYQSLNDEPACSVQ
mmetsp:Transcript_13229/g.29402  ORF Transcript_13229/g.29402 Transcript_13229/m.29402 type:complete len:619 (+) Transcript_13229:71-1927(+)|eukprot:CAMPEP_0204277220 /NCGR_PEP_ID=MMETSP0468-20130131/29166_1 /ASSEMBLY_ACC=CAM_ASM_000383 /TAXON_ID=2969 /ORGANISM="Oxyrrhis marina" /LENGTH=618 /DNA_ID=CAMNT_0051253959 /DNA_START=47 /DNA_END=1903 /DNA_ORIENTATION=-